MELRIQIQFILHKPCKMTTQDTSFMRRRWGPIIPYHRVLAQRYTDSDDFLRNIFHMLAHEVVAAGVEEDREGPRIAEGYEVRFARVVFGV